MVLAALAVVAALLTPADAAALPLDAQEPATLPDLPALDGASLWRSSSHTLFQTTSTGSFKAVTAGGHHTCGLKTDATITCWGKNGSGRADAPGGTFSAVTAGWRHTCGLKTDATITCWGNNDSGQADAPGGTFSAVTAGGGTTCGLKTDATITCWGRNDFGRADAPGGTFSAVTAGGGHTCGLKTDATITCWGYNRWGQAVAPGGTFSAVTAGGGTTCGLKTDATITCWGRNDYGEAVAPGGTFSAVTAGRVTTCGLKTDATITCWGYNDYEEAVAPGGTFSAVSAGEYHTCGLKTDATITCWGYNGFGQAVAPGGTFSAVSVGGGTTCGLKTDATITCWGDNGFGEAVAPGGTFSAVTVGGGTTCGLKTDATITCWGDNGFGRAVAPGGTFSAVTVGGGTTCGLKTDATITCWGDNDFGQAVAPGGTFSAVTVGGGTTCGLKTDATITCWGDNDFGQAVAPGGTFSAVTVGGGTTCGLKTDATITCWGDNDFGQADAPGGTFSAVTAGGGTTCGLKTDATITCWGGNGYGEADAPGGTFSAVTAGWEHTCGLKTDATITCWGRGNMRTADPVDEGGPAVDEQAPDETPGSVEDDPGRTPATQTTITTEEVSPGTTAEVVEEEVPEAEGVVHVLDVDDIVVQLAKVSGLRYDFGAERAVWEPVPGARSYLLAMWDGEQTRQLNVECCSYIIYLSQSDVEQINVRASNNLVNNPVEGPWSGWVSLLPEKVSDLQYERRPTINLIVFGTVAPDSITWRPVSNANAYDMEWTYSWAGLDTTLKRYDISPECAPLCRSYLVRRPSDDSRFRVRASNAAGKGPWSDWSSIRPERPDQVTGLRHDLANKSLVWSRASGAATYVVRLWDGETGRNVEQDACCSYAIDAKRDGITHFAVQATNSGGSGPWSDWQRILENPGNPTGPKVERHGLSGLRVWWRAPRDSGSSPISHYEVRYTRADYGRVDWSRTYYEADGNSHTKEGLEQGVEYLVWLISVNKDGLRSGGSGAYGTTASCPGGSRGAKYNKVDVSLWFDYFEAAQSFETVDGTLVTAGTKAGKIGDTSLSKFGCSWVFEDAGVVESDASVSGNAIVRDEAVVRDEASVYGDAIVEDGARIFDDAKVYDRAHVRDDATVRDHARVYGDAEVWGNDTEIQHYARVKEDAKVWDGATVKDHARVYGDAKVSGGAVIAGSGDNSDDGGVYAEIYGKAEVSGEAVVDGNAEVYGNARIYGEASVSGNAHVYGDAKVFGGAKVSGYARVFGTAEIGDGMEVSCSIRLHDDVSDQVHNFSISRIAALQPFQQECIYNGEFEFRRAALELYFKTWVDFESTLTDCLDDPDEAKSTTADLMAVPSSDVDRARKEIAEAIVSGCDRLEKHQKIIEKFAPGAVDIVVAYALGFGSAWRSSTFTKSLIDAVDLGNDVKSLSDAHAKLTAEIEKIRQDSEKDALRRQLLGSG